MGEKCMEEYLMETPSIDYMNPLFQDKVRELMNQSEDNSKIFIWGFHIPIDKEIHTLLVLENVYN